MNKPKKSVKEPKEEIIGVRLTTSQKVRIEAVAARKGLGVSTWLLYVGLEEVERQEREAR